MREDRSMRLGTKNDMNTQIHADTKILVKSMMWSLF